MPCSKALIEDPKDVLGLFDKHVLKQLVKAEPSEVEKWVFEVGRFSDTWAERRLRGRRLYAALFHSLIKPVGPDDPFTTGGSSLMTIDMLLTFCGPKSNATTWSGCIDSGYESGCLSPSTVANFTYGECGPSSWYGPYLFTISSAPAYYNDPSVVTAFAKPCPVASSSPDISGKPKMNETVKLRCVNGQDASNKIFFNRYLAVDSSTNTYSFAGSSLGASSNGTDAYHWIYALPGTSATKGSLDVYYFFLTTGFYYG
jgi:hypothetical protein